MTINEIEIRLKFSLLNPYTFVDLEVKRITIPYLPIEEISNIYSTFVRVLQQCNENILKKKKKIGFLKIRYYTAEWVGKKTEGDKIPFLSVPRRYDKNNDYDTDRTIMPYGRRVKRASGGALGRRIVLPLTFLPGPRSWARARRLRTRKKTVQIFRTHFYRTVSHAINNSDGTRLVSLLL
jgi:hypothetical protein